MARYRVNQIVQCTVRVWYEMDTNNQQDVFEIIKLNTSPTSKEVLGTDYEIISDDKIIQTMVEEVTENE